MATAEFLAKEQAVERKPIELFHFWNDSGTLDWYYASGDEEITYNGDVYSPAPIGRTATNRDLSMSVSKMSIKVERLLDPFVDYVTQIMPETIWVEAFKLHREQAPLEAVVVFIGQVSRPVFNGTDATIECIGFEKFLQNAVPMMRYQPGCNYALFDDRCTVTLASFETAATLSTINTAGTTITSAAFATQATGYFNLGFVTFNNYRRVVVEHTGDEITLQFPIAGLLGTSAVAVVPGCDKTMINCRDKFSNLYVGENRFFGFPYIPTDNPATWI